MASLSSPSADELDDFNLRARFQDCLGPARLFDYAPVKFDCHAGRVKLQLLQQAKNGLTLRGGLLLAVHDDVDGHCSGGYPCWLTPFFVPIIVKFSSRISDLMPNSYTELYFPILVQALLAMALAAGLLSVSALLGKRVRNRVKDMPYESGIVPTGDARQRFSVKFYLVGMLFILFDIEAIFLYPWVVVYRELKMFAFVEMLVFVVLILSGFFYIWKKGALDWSGADLTRRKP